jgi:hypothetical protein
MVTDNQMVSADVKADLASRVPPPVAAVVVRLSAVMRDVALRLLAASCRLHKPERVEEGVVLPDVPLHERVDVQLPDTDALLSCVPLGYIAAPGSLSISRRYVVAPPLAHGARTKTILFRNASDFDVRLFNVGSSNDFAVVSPGDYASIAFDKTTNQWLCGTSGKMETTGTR